MVRRASSARFVGSMNGKHSTTLIASGQYANGEHSISDDRSGSSTARINHGATHHDDMEAFYIMHIAPVWGAAGTVQAVGSGLGLGLETSAMNSPDWQTGRFDVSTDAHTVHYSITFGASLLSRTVARDGARLSVGSAGTRTICR